MQHLIDVQQYVLQIRSQHLWWSHNISTWLLSAAKCHKWSQKREKSRKDAVYYTHKNTILLLLTHSTLFSCCFFSLFFHISVKSLPVFASSKLLVFVSTPFSLLWKLLEKMKISWRLSLLSVTQFPGLLGCLLLGQSELKIWVMIQSGQKNFLDYIDATVWSILGLRNWVNGKNQNFSRILLSFYKKKHSCLILLKDFCLPHFLSF